MCINLRILTINNNINYFIKIELFVEPYNFYLYYEVYSTQ